MGQASQKFQLLCKGPRLYNKLPSHLRELENIANLSKKNVESYKAKLDEYLQTIFDIPGTSQNSLTNI